MCTEEKAVGNEKLFNFRPAFFLAIALCFGIAISWICMKKDISAWWIFACVPIAALLLFFYKRKLFSRRVLIAALSLLFALICGFVSALIQWRSYTDQMPINARALIVGRVVDKEKSDAYTICTLDRVVVGENKVKGKLVAYLPATFYENTRLGDRIKLQGNVENVGENGSVYEIQNGVRYYMKSEEFLIVDHSFSLFLYLRERIQIVVQTGMDETSAGVTLALLLGDTSWIELGLLENVRYGGIAHIFAVSGLHIGALFGACLLVFQKTKCRELSGFVRFVGVAAIVFFYGGICGYTPSVIRALVMCLTAYATKLLGISYDATETIGLCAILILLFSPISLFAVGFQLSFAACLGIVWYASRMQRAIEKKLGFEKQMRERRPLTVFQRVVRACVSIVCVSFSATVATAPIVLNAFGYLSGWSLLLNFIFTPMIGAAFSILLIFVGIACLLPTSFSPFVLYLPRVFWSMVLLLFQLYDFSSFALVGVNVPWIGVIAYYGGLIFCTDKWNLPRKYTCLLSGLCFFGFLLVTVFSNV